MSNIICPKCGEKKYISSSCFDLIINGAFLHCSDCCDKELEQNALTLFFHSIIAMYVDTEHKSEFCSLLIKKGVTWQSGESLLYKNGLFRYTMNPELFYYNFGNRSGLTRGVVRHPISDCNDIAIWSFGDRQYIR